MFIACSYVVRCPEKSHLEKHRDPNEVEDGKESVLRQGVHRKKHLSDPHQGWRNQGQCIESEEAKIHGHRFSKIASNVICKSIHLDKRNVF